MLGSEIGLVAGVTCFFVGVTGFIVVPLRKTGVRIQRLVDRYLPQPKVPCDRCIRGNPNQLFYGELPHKFHLIPVESSSSPGSDWPPKACSGGGS